MSTKREHGNANGNRIFVFGSNLAGRHGAGAALYARKYCGAVYGQGEGLQGSSYGIPTKNENLRPLPIEEIAKGVKRFVEFTRQNPQLEFDITPVGTGFAGFPRSTMRELFLMEGLPENAHLLRQWDE